MVGIDIFHIVFDDQGNEGVVPDLIGDEVDALVDFVAIGRSLFVFVGSGGTNSNELLTRFGMRAGSGVGSPAQPTAAMPVATLLSQR